MEQREIFKELKEYLECLKKGADYLEEDKFVDSSKIQDRQNNIEHKKFKIGLIGTFSSGKTTIIKALLEQKDLLPTSDSPTTSCITRICYGEKEEIEIKKDNKLLMDLLININSNATTLIQKTKNEKPRFDFKKTSDYFYKGVFDNHSSFKVSDKDKKEIEDTVNKAKEEAKEKNKFSQIPFLLTDVNGYFKIKNDFIPKEFSEEDQAYACNELDISENKIKEMLALQEVIEKILFNKEIKTIDLIKLKDIEFPDGLNIGLIDLYVSDCIKEIIIKTNKFNLGKDIELIDIPGLNNNEVHNKIATDIASDLQSLIIVQGIGGDTIEGKSKELILKIKTDFAKIFKNSYLLLNKCSINKEEQDKRLEALNDLKTTFQIKNERTFRIDALNYLNKDGKQEWYQFEEFKNKLKDDCENVLIKEFKQNVVDELNDIYIKIKNNLEVKIENINNNITQNEEESKRNILEEIKEKEYLKHFEKIKNNIIEIEYYNEEITDEEKTKMIKDSIASSFSKVNREQIQKRACLGKDIHSPDINKIVREMIDQCEFNKNVRDEYINLVKNKFGNKFSDLLNKYFDDSVLKFSSIKSKERLNKIKNRKIKERLIGVIDIIFVDYSPEKNSIENSISSLLQKANNCCSKTIKENGKIIDLKLENVEDIVNRCYENLEEQLKEYLERISKEIVKYTNAIIDNYIYDIAQELKEIFINDKNYEKEYKINIEKEEKNGIEEKIEKMKKELNEYEKIVLKLKELRDKIIGAEQ